jgi:hypothetical protein
VAGTAIDIVTVPIPGGSSFALTPILTAANNPFTLTWRVSNDKVNWFNLAGSSVVVINSSIANANYIWDFGFLPYKYIRCAITAGSFGAIKLKLQGYGKRLD